MGIDYNKTKKQLRFCSELMERLKNDIDNSTLIASYGLEKATRFRADIRRLRRELQDLSNMLDPYYELREARK